MEALTKSQKTIQSKLRDNEVKKSHAETKKAMIVYNSEHIDEIMASNKERFDKLRAKDHERYLQRKAG